MTFVSCAIFLFIFSCKSGKLLAPLPPGFLSNEGMLDRILEDNSHTSVPEVTTVDVCENNVT